MRKRLLSIIVVMVLGGSLLSGCASNDPILNSNESLYIRGNLYTWNGTAYQLVNTSLGGSSNGSGITNHALLSNLDYASAGHTGFQASLGFTPENSANKGVNSGYASLNATGKVPSSQIDFPTSTTAWGSITGTLSNQTDLQSALDSKQATLVSGTNIKTINGSTLLGSGDLTVTAGDHSHTADNITGGSANQTILSVNGRGSWTTLLVEHISGLVAALAGKLAATQAAILAALGYTPADNVTAQSHYANVSNPHSVTAAQVGALPTANVSVTAAANKVPSANTSGKLEMSWLSTEMSVTTNGGIKLVNDATSPGANQVYGTNAGGTKGWKADPSSGSSNTTFKRITANSATTSTSLVEIDGLWLPMAANAVYLVEAGWAGSVSAVTTGIRYGASYNGTLTNMRLQIVGSLLDTTAAMCQISSNNTQTTSLFGTTSGSTDIGVQVTGIVRTGGTAGNFSFKQLKVTSGTATVFADGWMRITRVE